MGQSCSCDNSSASDPPPGHTDDETRAVRRYLATIIPGHLHPAKDASGTIAVSDPALTVHGTLVKPIAVVSSQSSHPSSAASSCASTPRSILRHSGASSSFMSAAEGHSSSHSQLGLPLPQTSSRLSFSGAGAPTNSPPQRFVVGAPQPLPGGSISGNHPLRPYAAQQPQAQHPTQQASRRQHQQPSPLPATVRSNASPESSALYAPHPRDFLFANSGEDERTASLFFPEPNHEGVLMGLFRPSFSNNDDEFFESEEECYTDHRSLSPSTSTTALPQTQRQVRFAA